LYLKPLNIKWDQHFFFFVKRWQRSNFDINCTMYKMMFLKQRKTDS